jgi:RecA-family ATPase
MTVPVYVRAAEVLRPACHRGFIGITGDALAAKEFPPLNWVIPGTLPEGFFVLAGRIKLGKSWLLMDWSSAIALGGFAMGSILCKQGDVLHLALEDNERRLKERQASLLGDGVKPHRVEYNVTWPRLDQGGIEEMEKWVASVPSPRAIFIDSFKMFRRVQVSNEGLYDYDYSCAEPLRTLANTHQLAIVAVHHLNKRMDSDDPFDLVSGSNGLSACADGTLILNRDGQGCTLYGRGRDIPETDRALTFDKTTGR